MKPEKESNSISARGFAAMQDLTQGQKDTAGTFKRLGELLATSRLHGTLQVWLVPEDPAQESCFHVTFAPGKSSVGMTAANQPTVELITKPETWAQIAAGRLAPIDAFMDGLMRLRGDVTLAQKIMKHVAGSPGRTHFCLGGE